jgi:hypothetical protein
MVSITYQFIALTETNAVGHHDGLIEHPDVGMGKLLEGEEKGKIHN